MTADIVKAGSEPAPQTRGFRALVWLNRPHSAVLRHLFAALAFLQVLLVTGQIPLAREAGGIWANGRFKVGAHRLAWYLHHGWTGRWMTRLTGRRGRAPLFDPTTDMDAETVPTLARWLARRDDVPSRLAQLYVMSRQIRDAGSPEMQTGLLIGFEDLASSLRAALPAFAPKAPTGTTAGPNFTLDDACAALAALDHGLKMPWYIISGTFLGAVREGTFLSHDYDIDIGIHAEDFDETAFLETVSTAPDLTLVNTSAHLHLMEKGGLLTDLPRPALYRVMHASGIGIDVFIHHLDGELRWHGSAKHRWDNHDFALADYTIAGMTVRGPADADRYLTENYGDWRTPVKSFNCSTGTPNVSFTHNLSAVTETLHIAIQRSEKSEAMVALLVLRTQGYLPEGTDRFVIPWQIAARSTRPDRDFRS